jgi:hypothetical protein
MSVIFAISTTFVISAIFIIFVIYFFTFLFLIALTTLSNLGGCVTDYWYYAKAPSYHKIVTWGLQDRINTTHICLKYVLNISRIYLGYGQRLSHKLWSLASTFVYIYHLLFIDLQLSRLCNSLYCNSLYNLKL